MSSGEGVDTTIQHIELLIERGRYQHARTQTAEALALQPANRDLLYFRAHIELLDGRLDLAESAARDLLAVEPASYGGRLILFHVYEDTKRSAQAEELIISLIRDYPKNPAGYTNYSRLMLKTHNFAKAKALAREALKLDPEGEGAQLALALCNLIEGGLDPGIDLAGLVERNPESLSVIAMLATSLAQANRTKEAQALAEELVRADPDNAAYIDFVVDLRLANHWLMKPLWPMRRWGWGGSIGIWFVAVVGLSALENTAFAGASAWLVPLLLAYVVYSWAAPPLLRRWLKR